jgi:hypothetical protein
MKASRARLCMDCDRCTTFVAHSATATGVQNRAECSCSRAIVWRESMEGSGDECGPVCGFSNIELVRLRRINLRRASAERKRGR